MSVSNPYLTILKDEEQIESGSTSDVSSVDNEEVIEFIYDDEDARKDFGSPLSKVQTNEERHESFMQTIPFHRRRSSIKSSIQKTVPSGKKPDFEKQLVEDFKQNDILVTPNLNPVEKSLSKYQHSLFIKHKKYHTGMGISAILSRPATDETNLHKGILLLHGHCGHKNYINLPIIDDLLQKDGYYILRVDFRGLGNSEENADLKMGRTLSQDLEDIETCYLFFRDIVNVKLDTIIAHSRAVISMFSFHLFLQKKYGDFIPNLINCSGRYDNDGLRDKILKKNPNWVQDQGYYASTFRYGSLQKIFIPYEESMSVITVDSKKFAKIDQRCSILSVYGCKEDVMPLSAATKYDKLFKQRHQLILIDNADHNFFGIVIDDPNNPFNLPTKRGKINYNYLVGKHIEDYLSIDNKIERFATFNNTTNCTRVSSSNNDIMHKGKHPVLTYPRWPAPSIISKVRNLRDFGGYTTLNEKLDTRGGIFYKSGSLKKISTEGVLLLKNALRLEKIYVIMDKNETEMELLPNDYDTVFKPLNITILNLNDCNCSNQVELVDYYYDSFLNMNDIFKEIIEFTAIKKKFTLIGQENGILFVSKKGHIKTSLISLILLKLLGVDDYTICMEHCLTRWANNNKKKRVQKNNTDIEYITTNDSLIMMKLIERINTTFGSIEDYVTNVLEIDFEIIMKLREQYLV
ncbi:hypothetical protein ACO0SA_002108 [Hanseniaspora valbyensis]